VDVILFGPPGAGKGTQAVALSEHLAVPHVATGDIFRRHLTEGTELGVLAKGFMDRGELVPDAVVVKLVATRLSEADASSGAVLDGFPRTVTQAELLVAWLLENGRSVDVVLSLVVEPALLVRRLAGRRTCMGCGATYHVDVNPPTVEGVCDRCGGAVVQRADDLEATVQARLGTYARETAPVLAWLSERVQVVNVDGAQPIEAVRAQLFAALASAQAMRS
jgi:adenylate kinase